MLMSSNSQKESYISESDLAVLQSTPLGPTLSVPGRAFAKYNAPSTPNPATLNHPQDGCSQRDGDSAIQRSSGIKLIHESAGTRVYRLRDTDGEYGAADSDVAIKALVDPTPNPQQLSRLLNEHNVLVDHLSRCRSVRRALRRAKMEGQHALYLEWAPGVTLREWIRRNGASKGRLSLYGRANAKLIDAARLARDVAAALQEIHASGVRHNKVNADNIIIESIENEEEGLVEHKVTIIDFGSASLDDETLAKSRDRCCSSILPLQRRSSDRSVQESITSVRSSISAVISTRSSCENGRGKSTSLGNFEMPRGSITLPNTHSIIAGEVDANAAKLESNDSRTEPIDAIFAGDKCNFAEQPVSTDNGNSDIQGDLRALGAVFHQMFTGNPGLGEEAAGIDALDVNSGCEVSRRDSNSQRDECKALPRSLLAVLCDMMGIDSENVSRLPYGSAADVAKDLDQMVKDPVRFLFDPTSNQMTGRLDLNSKRLYGRKEEESKLAEVYERVCLSGGQTELVLISGCSGTGKSTLVKKVFQRFSEKEWNCGRSRGEVAYFLSGKFDQLRQAEPYAAISDAFMELCDLILAQKNEFFTHKISANIREAIGSPSEVQVLTDVIPRLSSIIGDAGNEQESSDIVVRGKNAQNRFNFLFRMFVRAISTQDKPVVIFLDDCQWADAASIDLIKVLLTDAENTSLLFVAAYRDNEIASTHPFATVCSDLKDAGVAITSIEIGNFAEVAIGNMVSDATWLPRRTVQSLTRIVHRKTQGNIFFVIQFLNKLCDEGLLHFSQDAMRWQWDEGQIESLDITDNVVDLLADMIVNKVSEATQHVLKVAACLGSHFDISTLRLVVNANSTEELEEDYDLIDTLQMAVTAGMVVQMGSGAKYMFTHDRIQQAAYSLIPLAERDSFHLKIGELIARDPIILEKMIFVAVDQLNVGSTLISDPADRLRLARLNLRAAERAIASSAFVAAGMYFRSGLNNLGNKRWEGGCYELSLRLCNALAEIEYCTGDFDSMNEHLQEVFLHTTSLSGKLSAHITLIKSLAARGELLEAVDTGFGVLTQLGESFPKEVHKPIKIIDFLKTKAVLRGTSDDRIMALRTMRDSNKVATMEVLNSISVSCFLRRPQHFPLVVFRMVRLSLKHGLCRLSAVAFAWFAMILCTTKDIKEGHRFGHLALLILERFKAKELVSSVHHLVYVFVTHWWEHVELALNPLLTGYQVGLETGDVESASFCARAYAQRAFQCSKPLVPLEKELRKFSRMLAEYKQNMMLFFTNILWQTVLNLIGPSDDPVLLKGEAMDQDQMLKASSQSNPHIKFTVNNFVSKLAYLFGDYGLAADTAEEARKMVGWVKTRYECCVKAFYDGLIALAMARQTKQRRWKVIAQNEMKNVKRWAKYTPQNCLHMILLLEAEMLALGENAAKAVRAYDSAITAARKHGFLQEEAISCERAAMFLLDSDNEGQSLEYYTQAYQAYLDWGAAAKADQFEKHYSTVKEERQCVFMKGQVVANSVLH